jgi:hypothetical protein
MSYEMPLYDPMSGIKVELFASNEARKVWRPYTQSVIQIIKNNYRNFTDDDAYSMLINSDIDNPIVIGCISFWVE